MNKCPGSQTFPTSYDGSRTKCPECGRTMKLHVNGRLPNHRPDGPPSTDPPRIRPTSVWRQPL